MSVRELPDGSAVIVPVIGNYHSIYAVQGGQAKLVVEDCYLNQTLFYARQHLKPGGFIGWKTEDGDVVRYA
jgi:hypothetical protein